MRRIYLTGAVIVLLAIVTLGFTLSASATSWGNTFFIDEPAKNPDVAIDSNGGLHFVWLNAKRSRLQYRYCSGANTCDAVEKLPALKGDAFALALALDSQDRPNVVWEQRKGVESAIYYSRRNDGGWSEPYQVSSDTDSHLPDIAIGPDDVKHIVFEGIRNDARVIYHTTRGGNSNTLQVIEVESTNAANRVSAGRNVRVAVDSKDRAHIVWSTETDPPRIKYAYQNAGGEFFPPLTVAD